MPDGRPLEKWTVELRSRSEHFFTWIGYAANKPAACKAARDAYGAAWAILAGDACGPPGAKAVARANVIEDGIRTWIVHDPMSQCVKEHRVNGKPRRPVARELGIRIIGAVLDTDPSNLRDGGCLKASGFTSWSQIGGATKVALTDDAKDERAASQTTALCVMAAFFAVGDTASRVDVGFDASPSATLTAGRKIARTARNAENPRRAHDLLDAIGAKDAAKAVLKQAIATREAHHGA